MSAPAESGQNVLPWFDDLEPGTKLASAARAIEADAVTSFAHITGDMHPLHLDDEFAAGTPFGRRIAHGLLVLSAGVGALPLDPERVVALRRLDKVVFKRPVPVGGEIVAEARVAELREVDESVGLVTFDVKIRHEGAAAVLAQVQVLWRRTPGAGE